MAATVNFNVSTGDAYIQFNCACKCGKGLETDTLNTSDVVAITDDWTVIKPQSDRFSSLAMETYQRIELMVEGMALENHTNVDESIAKFKRYCPFYYDQSKNAAEPVTLGRLLRMMEAIKHTFQIKPVN